MTDREKKQQLLDLVKEVVAKDKTLRDQFKIGEKFRFIRDRLALLLTKVEESLIESQQEEANEKVDKIADDEIMVYVHLFNAQGLVLDSWQKLLLPSVFYEYSVNRPIYAEKSHIESFIRSKANKVQHGYLTVIIKKSAIMPSESNKDAIGNPLIKVKEGALSINQLCSFTHNHHDYTLNSNGQLVKKA